MIGYLKGTISHLFAEYCFIDVQGVGYRVFIPFSTREKLELGVKTSLYTYLNVREDVLMLFGFYTAEEYEMFMHLISVTGIGPKVALNILSKVNPDDFYFSISHKKIDFLTKIPGVGKKTAERIILDLKDKVTTASTDDNMDFMDGKIADKSGAYFSNVQQDAIAALVALGYNQNEAAVSVKKIADKTKNGQKEYPVQELVKQALKNLATR